MNLLGAVLIIVFGFLFVTVSSRLTGELGSSSNPISGMTVATLLLTCLVFLRLGWTGPSYYVTALSVGAIVCIAASNGGTISQDLKTGFLIGSTPRHQQVAMVVGSVSSALLLGPILLGLNEGSTVYVPRLGFEPPAAAGAAVVPGPELARLPAWTGSVQPPRGGSWRLLRVAPGAEGRWKGLTAGDYLVDAGGRPAWKSVQNFPAGLRAVPAQLGGQEKLKGPQALQDGATYRVWQKLDDAGGPPGRYLVDAAGVPVYLVDPGINGTHPVRPDGTRVPKFDAPKATLMSYIIKGILNRQLPWALVLLGVMISVVLEMAGIPSLAFAVGVYLPLSSSSPIFVGGLVRLLVDLHLRRKLAHRRLSEEQLAAEGDRSPGVLMASGYIAGGAIAGIVIAFTTGVLTRFDERVGAFMTRHNPLFAGPAADALALLPFAVLVALLYLAGREAILAGKGRA
jgi:hypothetical protein